MEGLGLDRARANRSWIGLCLCVRVFKSSQFSETSLKRVIFCHSFATNFDEPLLLYILKPAFVNGKAQVQFFTYCVLWR